MMCFKKKTRKFCQKVVYLFVMGFESGKSKGCIRTTLKTDCVWKF